MKILKTLNRVYVNNIKSAVRFYEKLCCEKCSSVFEYKEKGLVIANVGPILIISGENKALTSFKSTSVTFLVDSVREFRKFLICNGAEIIRDIKKVPTGFNMTVRHSDGMTAEYVEHIKKQAGVEN